MIEKIGISFADIKNELLKDPETAAAYEDMEPEYRIISDIIKARIEQNLTQEELAAKIGTKQCNISRLEGGNYNPSIRFLKKVAKGLGKKLRISLV